MNKDDWKRVITRSLSGFVALAMAIVLYFVILRFGQIQGGIRWIKEILTPFVYGGIMAYLLKSPCNYFEHVFEKWLPKKWKKRAGGLAVLVVVVLAVSVVWLLLAAVLPQLVESIMKLLVDVPAQINRFTKWVTGKLEGQEAMYDYAADTIQQISDRLTTWFQNDFSPMLDQMLGSFASTLTSIVNLIYDLFIGVIVCVYVLCSRKTFARQGKQVLYAAAREPIADRIMEELRFADHTFTGFFAGKILDSTIVGLITYVFCLILSFVMKDFPNVILISVVIGVTNIIPYFGPFIGAIPCLIIIYISNPFACVVFLIFILILQQIDGNILGPKLLANSVGLSAFWVLFSITLFGGLFGFAGILAGVPTFAVIYDLIRRMVYRKLRHKGLQEAEEKVAYEEYADASDAPDEEDEAQNQAAKPDDSDDDDE